MHPRRRWCRWQSDGLRLTKSALVLHDLRVAPASMTRLTQHRPQSADVLTSNVDTNPERGTFVSAMGWRRLSQLVPRGTSSTTLLTAVTQIRLAGDPSKSSTPTTTDIDHATADVSVRLCTSLMNAQSRTTSCTQRVNARHVVDECTTGFRLASATRKDSTARARSSTSKDASEVKLHAHSTENVGK